MGLLADYRKRWQERRLKHDQAQAEALKSLHDEPSATHRHNPGASEKFPPHHERH